MGFKTGEFPDVDPATFMQRRFLDRIRATSTHWVDHGFGTPKVVQSMYVAKLFVLYVGLGASVATMTSGISPLDVGAWWNEPIVYQKLILWTVLLECLGLAGSWGPLAGHFKPMTGGVRYWLRRGTIRLAPWPTKVPFTSGDSRTSFDVALYAGLLLSLLAALLLPGIHTASIDTAVAENSGLVRRELLFLIIILLLVLGLRDKVIFLAARGEQYVPAMVFFAMLPFVDMIVALKLLMVAVWIGAGVSKIGHHFSMVIPPMLSNAPWLPFASVKRAQYRKFPDDLRPSLLGSGIGHVLGTIVEIVTPLVLLFSTNSTITLLAVALMVSFHLFILSTFPLAVPLEWNAMFAYATVFLFWGFPAWEGFGVNDVSSVWLFAAILTALVFFPILGNVRPDLVSFLPSMRQYSGNWATGMWAFAPGAERKLDERMPRPAQGTRAQLCATYSPDEADVILHQILGWRAMHSTGRAMISLLMNHLGDDMDRYSIREAEFMCNTVVAFNFGDGHFHDERLIAAIQRRCAFAPGEFLVAWVESQPIHKSVQEYKVIDAAVGVIERGTYKVADAIAEQPWLPNGPISFDVRRSLQDDRSPVGDTLGDIGGGRP